MNEHTADKQQLAVERVLETSSGNETYIGGVAGSGKTYTLVEAFHALRSEDIDVVVLAPTNKAAHVMRQRGIPASTIHSFMYNIREETILDQDGKPELDARGQPKTKLLMFHKLDDDQDSMDIPDYILVDECSMVGGRLKKDLDRFKYEMGVAFAYFGDAFQLPPVKDEVIFQVRTPDVFLDEIHRVAAGNPVLQYADFIRNHPSSESYPDWDKFSRAHLNSFEAERLFVPDSDTPTQVICWTNRVRNDINQQIRALKGFFGPYPEPGESLIVLNNVYEKKLYNGTFIKVIEIEDRNSHLKARVSVEDEDRTVQIDMSKIWYGSTDTRRVKAHVETDFSYCITAHKSQGSEWPNIVVVDQRSWMKEEAMRQSWFYTAITRTRDKLSIVR